MSRGRTAPAGLSQLGTAMICLTYDAAGLPARKRISTRRWRGGIALWQLLLRPRRTSR